MQGSLVLAHQAGLRQLAEQVQRVGIRVLLDIAVFHFDGVDFRVRTQLHEDQRILVGMLEAVLDVGAADEADAFPRVHAGVAGGAHGAYQFQQVLVHGLGDQGGLVAEQRVHDGGGKSGRFGHFADGNGARATLFDEILDDVDDVLAPRLSLA